MIAHHYIALLNEVTGYKKKFRLLYSYMGACSSAAGEMTNALRRAVSIETQDKKIADERDTSRVIDQMTQFFRQAEVGKLFLEIHECKREAAGLALRLGGFPSAKMIVDSFSLRLDRIEVVIQSFLVERDAHSALTLLEATDDLFRAYELTSLYSDAALEVLAPEVAAPPDMDELTL